MVTKRIESQVPEVKITTYSQLTDFYKKLKMPHRKWIFRGEEYDQRLRTSLEKAFKDIAATVKEKDFDKHKLDAERDIIRDFQRKLHFYTNNIPTRADILQWLALMQHHGAPTRLLDWTYSFWVAVHFATTRHSINEKTVIWAIDTEMLKDNDKKFLDQNKCAIQIIETEIKKQHDMPYSDPSAIKNNAAIHFLIENPKPVICFTGSFRQNQRLTLQQGVFLALGDIRKSFWENLNTIDSKIVRKCFKKCIITLKKDLKKDIILNLRQMNINNAVLFPDIDGFSQSLWTRVALSHNLKLLIKDLKLYEW